MSTVDEASTVFPRIRKYRKLAVALVGTTAPFVVWLLSGDHSTAEVALASESYVFLNFGIYSAKNEAR